MRSLALAVALIGCVVTSAGAGSGVVAVNKISPLQLIVTGITVDCNWPVGTKVLTLGTLGGNGNPVSYTFGGTPPTDLVMSANAVVVGPGMAPCTAATVENVTIVPSQ